MLDVPQRLSHVRPHRGLRLLGALVVLLAVGTGALLMVEPGDSRPAAALLALCAVALAVLGLHLALTSVSVSANDAEVTVSYWPRTLRIPRTDILEIVPSDRVDGVGFGYGYRWEGRGRRAIRVGGPVVTVIHRAGRLGVSVNEPQRVADLLQPHAR